jgi:flagellar FliL protein
MTVTAIPHTPTTPPEDQTKVAKPGRRKKIILVLVAVLALGGGGYWFLSPKPATAPKPGDVLKLDPIQINLASSHYLRIGIALQLVAGASKVDGSKALDATIDEFSGLAMPDVNDPAKRTTYKKELEKQLHDRYEGEVMGVYFTEFVTQ